MPQSTAPPSTLGDLRRAVAAGAWPHRPVKDELRSNLLERLRTGELLFPGVIEYDDSVVPQMVSAILSRHNFILLGLRGQAQSRGVPPLRIEDGGLRIEDRNCTHC